MKAQMSGTCSGCGERYPVKTEIARLPDGSWGHSYCKQFMANKARINAGETYRGTSTGYQRKAKRRDGR